MTIGAYLTFEDSLYVSHSWVISAIQLRKDAFCWHLKKRLCNTKRPNIVIIHLEYKRHFTSWSYLIAEIHSEVKSSALYWCKIIILLTLLPISSNLTVIISNQTHSGFWSNSIVYCPWRKGAPAREPQPVIQKQEIIQSAQVSNQLIRY